jgi:hypothetical protein
MRQVVFLSNCNALFCSLSSLISNQIILQEYENLTGQQLLYGGTEEYENDTTISILA